MRLMKRSSSKTVDGTRQVRGPGAPITLHGRPGDRYFERATPKGQSESRLQWLLAHGVRADGVVLDVGANVGLTAVMIARACRGPVYAFEPHPETFGFLSATLIANRADNVTPFNLGLGAAPGTLPFFVDPDSSASHVVTPHTRGRQGAIAVEITTIDDIALPMEAGVSFIKLDAEGSEPDIIAGGRATILRDRPALFVEFNLFTLMAISNINPRQMLTDLLELFRYVYRFSEDKPYPIDSEAAVIDFLHDAITRQAASTDLFCTFDPL